MRLSELKSGESGVILKILGYGGFRRRIMEMGFIRAQRVEVLLNAPLKDPIKYRIMGYEVSLRRSEAEMIEIITESEALNAHITLQSREDEHSSPVPASELLERVANEHSRTIRVALVGNPNSGKTSLFNIISGSHEHVGNYSGVTIDAKRGHRRYNGYRFEITDLPGTYALTAYSPEERYVREHINTATPDVIINTVAASNLERNLYLTTELIDISPRMVMALNMYDELEASGAKLDYDSLGGMLGVPIIPTDARKGRGVEELLDTIIELYEGHPTMARHIHINLGGTIESSLKELSSEMKLHAEELPKSFPPRYFAMKLLEGDAQVEEQLRGANHFSEWRERREHEAKHITQRLGEDVETAITNQKYGFIQGALLETYKKGKSDELQATKIIDTFVTHRVWGFPLFLVLMWLMFWATFTLGAYPQGWIEAGVGWLHSTVTELMPEGLLRDMITDGVIAGVGSVIVFLPLIMILYLFISLFENSGYMARTAFIMDRLMHKVGLHGKSVIPMLMGFGCNVPAIMAARGIESRSSRIITIMVLPLISCATRLPVFMIFINIFFFENRTLVAILLYLLGVALAMLTAHLMRRFLYPVDETPFVMELPPYRVPTLRGTLIYMWDKSSQYLRKMGGMILIGSIAIWFLSNYPKNGAAEGGDGAQRGSYIEMVGEWCEPAVEPLGLDWKASVAILSGLPAKEFIISTLGILYNNSDEQAKSNDDEASALEQAKSEDEEASALEQRIKRSEDYTPASALAFLVFTLLYVPCIATVAAIGAEIGWRWAGVSVLYTTSLAWVMAWIVYRIALLF